jgi:hypothetical protein
MKWGTTFNSLGPVDSVVDAGVIIVVRTRTIRSGVDHESPAAGRSH